MLDVPMMRKAGHAWPERLDFTIVSLASARPAAKTLVKLGVTSKGTSRKGTGVSYGVLLARLIHVHGRVHVHKSASPLPPALK